MAKDFNARFWAKVTQEGEDACWEWQAYRNREGYGKMRHYPTGIQHAHRMAFLLATGVDPGPAKVLHSCDNPPCCNPRHLRLGSDADNVRDRDSRGRHRPLRGLANGRGKLSDEDVRAIRCSTASRADLARRYGVVKGHIKNVLNGNQRAGVI